MKLETGKRYIRRDGSVTDPLVVGEGTDKGWLIDTTMNLAFDPASPRGHLVFSFIASDFDLVMEYEE